jgi:hypothetical protein
MRWKKTQFLKKVSNDHVECPQCRSEFPSCHGRYSDIKHHLQTTDHKSSLEVAAITSPVIQFF